MRTLPSTISLTTERLLIRDPKMSDAVPLNEAVQYSQAYLMPWLPFAKNPTLENTETFIEHGIHCWQEEKQLRPMIVEHLEDDKVIGSLGFNEGGDMAAGIYELGYWIDIRYSQKGLMTEAVNAVTEYMFKHIDFKQLQIRVQIGNEASSSVAKKCGYKLSAWLKNDRIDILTGKQADANLYVKMNN